MSHYRALLVLLVSACVVVALAACKPSPSEPATTVSAAVDGSTDPVASDTVTAGAQDAPFRQFHARGNEPFWSVRVDGTELVWTTPEMQPGKPLVAERSVSAEDFRFIGSDGDKAFVLEIHRTPCKDSMSGQSFGFTASFTYHGEKMSGCASAGL
ncbi:MAG: COG3650 family protein [Lysobacter sp.]